jgi:hypothetical protein
MTNHLFLLSVVLTNWVSNGDWKREHGTNYVGEQLQVVTNVYIIEVMLCTNRTIVRMGQPSTNGPTRWVTPVDLLMFPGQFQKQ